MLNFRLRRISTHKKLIEEIDGLRFIAILLVFITHLDSIWMHNSEKVYTLNSFEKIYTIFIHNGGYGVDLFFIISGFILATPWVNSLTNNKPTPSLKSFYIRRLTRLEPPYIVSSIAFFVLLIILGKYSFGELWGHLLATLAYVHNFVYGYGSTINRAAWSLEIEIQFYLLAPLLIPLFFKFYKKYPYLLIAINTFYPFFINRYVGFSHTGLHNFLHYFVSGVIWATIYCTHKEKLKPNYLFDFILLITVIGSYFVFTELGSFDFYRVIIHILINIIFASCFLGKFFNKFLKLNFVSITGGMCYSIYLLHGRTISIPIEFLKNYLDTGSYSLDLTILFMVIAPFTLFICTIFYILIERPCMDKDWPKKLFHAVKSTFKYHS